MLWETHALVSMIRQAELFVEIESKPLAFLAPEVSGLALSEQAVLAAVRDSTGVSQHVIVSLNVAAEASAASRLEAIAALFPARHVSLVVAQSEGSNSMISRPAEPSVLLAAAAATATIARSWAWDESPTIAVTIATPDEARFVLDPVFTAGAWSVRQTT